MPLTRVVTSAPNYSSSSGPQSAKSDVLRPRLLARIRSIVVPLFERLGVGLAEVDEDRLTLRRLRILPRLGIMREPADEQGRNN